MDKKEIHSALYQYVKANVAFISDNVGYDEEEILDGVEEGEEPNEDLIYNIAQTHDDYKKVVVHDVGGFHVKIEDHDGGDGDGSEMYMVLQVTKGAETVYIKFGGYRSSHDRDQWNEDFTVVEPRMVLVRQWFGPGE